MTCNCLHLFLHNYRHNAEVVAKAVSSRTRPNMELLKGNETYPATPYTLPVKRSRKLNAGERVTTTYLDVSEWCVDHLSNLWRFVDLWRCFECLGFISECQFQSWWEAPSLRTTFVHTLVIAPHVKRARVLTGPPNKFNIHRSPSRNCIGVSAPWMQILAGSSMWSFCSCMWPWPELGELCHRC